jgi:hypothetical protein
MTNGVAHSGMTNGVAHSGMTNGVAHSGMTIKNSEWLIVNGEKKNTGS